MVEATRKGHVHIVATLLKNHPEKLHVRIPPYEWTLLHVAAQNGHLSVVDLLLKRGLDVNSREKGDNTYAMHWAAAAGHVEVVRRLAEAGGDVVGEGDDHELQVIGWAAAAPDAAHRAVADLLVSRGARHHIFSAIAFGDVDEVRRIVTNDPSAMNRRMSGNENHQTPLHFAVREKHPQIVALLLELGADPLATDDSGFPPAAYASAPNIDRPLMERIRTMVLAELDGAARERRKPRIGLIDILAVLALRDWKTAAYLAREDLQLLTIGAGFGALHLMAKRGDAEAVKWLLDHGAEANARWSHWDADVTPLHLAVLGGHADVARMLLRAGADPHLRDSKHDSNAIGWAEFLERSEILQLLQTAGER